MVVGIKGRTEQWHGNARVRGGPPGRSAQGWPHRELKLSTPQGLVLHGSPLPQQQPPGPHESQPILRLLVLSPIQDSPPKSHCSLCGFRHMVMDPLVHCQDGFQRSRGSAGSRGRALPLGDVFDIAVVKGKEIGDRAMKRGHVRG